MHRPRIAMFSPVNPVRSGISDYTEEMLVELSGSVDIDLYLDGYEPENPAIRDHAAICMRRDYEWRCLQTPYDLNVYQLGNNAHHQYIFPVLFRHPGLVLLHDANLHRARAFKLLNEREVDAYFDEMDYCHGEMGRKVADLVFHGYQSELIFDAFPMLKLVCDAASHVAVHNAYSRDVVMDSLPSGDVTVITAPLLDTHWSGRDPARNRLDIPSSHFIIAAFGFLTPGKGLESVCRAFARYAAKDPEAHLYLVGKALDSDYADTLLDFIPAAMRPRLHITGFVDSDAFNAYLSATDVCVNLRYPTQGETSSALLRTMGAGKPVLIHRYRQFTEFPADACVHIPPAPDVVTSICDALEYLRDHPEEMHRIGRRAAAFVRRDHARERWRDDMIALIKQQIEEEGPHEPLSSRCDLAHLRAVPVTEQVAAILAPWEDFGGNDMLIESVSSVIEELNLDE